MNNKQKANKLISPKISEIKNQIMCFETSILKVIVINKNVISRYKSSKLSTTPSQYKCPYYYFG